MNLNNNTQGGAIATATGGIRVTDPGDQTCTPPQLTVTKTPDGGTYRLGEKASFTIVVASTGQTTAHNVMLPHTLCSRDKSSGVYTSAPPTAGTCAITGNVNLSCTFGDLAPGQT